MRLSILLLLASIQIAFGQKTIEEKMQATADGQTMPNFKIYDIEGNALSFYDFEADIIVLDVWASWCGPCRRQAPYFKAIAEKLGSEKVLFLSISIDGRMKKWQKFLAKKDGDKSYHYWSGDKSQHPIEWLTYSIEGPEGNESLVAGVPRFVIIGKDHKIINRNADFASQSLEQQIEVLIQEYGLD
jgi:thiol-disulfide isomerase/thioredoxin